MDFAVSAKVRGARAASGGAARSGRFNRAVSVRASAPRDIKLTHSQSVSLDGSAPISGAYQQPAQSSGPGLVPTVLGGVALLGVCAVAWKKSSKAITAVTDKLPWSKASRDLKMVESLNNFERSSLSENTIAAARARRSKESANQKMDLNDIELPDNHPWATKRKDMEVDGATAAERLRVQRRARPAAPPPRQHMAPGGERPQRPEMTPGGERPQAPPPLANGRAMRQAGRMGGEQ
ncbi:hypothetical protein FOA52_000310 [Chlamydomonas sp. UWO 241]|nr:hypothetical protein FOA52_000310 [Chlamydomonas sp. UWO 241]